MNYFWFIVRLMLIIAALGALQVIMMRNFNRPWWETKIGRRLSLFWPLVTLIVTPLTFWSFTLGREHWVAQNLLLLSAVLLVGLIAAIFSLPISGLLNLTDKLILRFRGKQDSSPDIESQMEEVPPVSRRSFLKLGAAVVPAIATTGAISGVVRSFDKVRIFERELKFSNLPPELDGFKILHLCDLHLGAYYDLSDLENLVEKLSHHSFDLVALIGDVADSLDQLSPALEMIHSLKSTHGHFATLGNHEYYRGIQAVLYSYGNSSINLLINEGVELAVGETSLYVGGADDPAGTLSWGDDKALFFRNAIDKAMNDANSDSFKLLLTHRPSAFNVAANEKIDLSLAGHTHGAQLGFMGRSTLDYFGDEFYLWGEYARGASKLYTSSGVGHWFPFRLGCPAEAPIFTLRRG